MLPTQLANARPIATDSDQAIAPGLTYRVQIFVKLLAHKEEACFFLVNIGTPITGIISSLKSLG
ncbi:MAG: hypothetical protein JOZ43_07650 [Acidobacteriales bacterium]|nr:hypothetical protein [Terriglobales bacterium]